MGSGLRQRWRETDAARRSFFVVGALTWLVVGVIAARSAMTPGAGKEWVRFSFLDYRDTVWVPVLDFMRGNVPWDTPTYLSRHPDSQMYPVYLPSYWWATWWLLLVSYRVSVFLWSGILVASLGVMVLMTLYRFAPRHLAAHPWLLSLLLPAMVVSRPVRTCFSQGQWALPAAAGVLMAVLSTHQGCRTVGALAALVKPPVAVPMVLVQAALGRWGLMARSLAWSIGLTAPVLALCAYRVGGPGVLLAVLRDNLSLGAGDEQYDRTETLTNVAGVFSNLQFSGPGWIPAAATLVLGLVMVGAVGERARRLGAVDEVVLSGVLLMTLVLTPNYLYAAVVLIPAMLALVVRACASLRRENTGDAALAVGSLLLMCVPQFVAPAMLRVVGGTSDDLNVLNGLCVVAASVMVAVWSVVGGRWVSRPGKRHAKRSVLQRSSGA